MSEPLDNPADELIHVLFVDDEAAILASHKRSFRNKPYQTHFAENGELAMTILQSQVIDVLVTDKSMPVMSGDRLLSEARKINPDLIRIMLSGQADDSEVIDMLNRDVIDAFLAKPWDMHELQNIITLAVRKRDAENFSKKAMHQKLQDYRMLAGVDEATLTASPERLEESLLTQIEIAKRYDVPFSLVMFEVDHLDWLLDKTAMQADYIHVHVCNAIQQRMRILDILGRWENNTFMLICPHTDLVNAMIVAEDLRVLLEEHDFGMSQKITASFGVCSFKNQQVMRYELIANTYQSMLAAKDSGGNHVITLSPGRNTAALQQVV